MRPEEIALAIDWADAEGWNPGLDDAECFAAADARGFVVGLDDGEPVATISAVRYGDDFAFVGMYIVRPDARGRGFGIRTWEAAIEGVAGRALGLDGVPAQQANYARSGFVLAHRNVRYEGLGGGAAPDDAGLVDLATVPLAEVLAYDLPFFPAGRDAFLARWIRPAQGTALGAVRDGRLAGYGVIRRCRRGHKIGPLFADDAGGAEALLLGLRATAPGESVALDVPEPNAAAVALAERHGMAPAFETARMYTGSAPALPLDRLWGITTFELG